MKISTRFSIKKLLFFALTILLTFNLTAQQSIVGVYTDFNGFTESTSSTLNNPSANSDNNLLGITIGTTTFSTGVNDALLTTNGVTFIAGDYRALIPSVAQAGNAGQGALDDGIIGWTNADNGGSAVGSQLYDTLDTDGDPNNGAERDVRAYLTDGIKGLGMSTFANNVGGTLIFDLTNVDPTTVGDGIPDFIYFNMADPSTSAIVFEVYDSNGVLLGSAQSVENAHPDVYSLRNDRFRTRNGNVPNSNATVNDLQFVQGFTLELSDLVTQAQMLNATELRVVLPAEADPPFISYNRDAFTALDPNALCDISAITTSNNSACEPTTNNFTADVTITFENAPETGILSLTGDGSATVSVTALDSPVSHTFTGVTFNSSGAAISLSAAFSDDGTCTFDETNAGTAEATCSTDPCIAGVSGNPDNDNDNISDVCDLDDDNDGIEDEDEQEILDCTTLVAPQFGAAQGPNNYLGSNVANPQVGDAFLYNNVYTNVDAIITIVSSTDTAINVLDEAGFGLDDNFQPQIDHANANSFTEFRIDFIVSGTANTTVTPAALETFVLTTIDNDVDEFVIYSDEVDSELYVDNPTIEVPYTGAALSPGFTRGFESDGTVFGGIDVDTPRSQVAAVYTLINSVSFRFGSNGGVLSNHSIALLPCIPEDEWVVAPVLRSDIDTDGDGVFNRLDTDSDNDGCPDSIESGGVDADSNGVLDGTGFDTDGLVTGGSGGYNGLTGNEVVAVDITSYNGPSNQAALAGSGTSFSVTGATARSTTTYTGTAPNTTPDYTSGINVNAGINYQWYIGDPDNGGTIIDGMDTNYTDFTTATLNIVNVTGLNQTDFCVVISHNDNLCIREIACATLIVDEDTDNDLVFNSDDVDDDNDGILDINECTFTDNFSPNSAPTKIAGPGSQGNVRQGDVYQFNNAVTLDGINYHMRFSFVDFNGVNGNDSVSLGNNGNIAINLFDAEFSNNIIVEYTIVNANTNLPEVIDAFSVAVGDIDGGIGANNNGRVLEIVGVETNVPQTESVTGQGPLPIAVRGWSVNGNNQGAANRPAGYRTYRQGGTAGSPIPNGDTTHDLTLVYSQKSSFRIMYGLTARQFNNQNVQGSRNFPFRFFRPIQFCDTDGDGVNDNEDLDSDGDGCDDVLESGGLDADGDGIIDDATPGNSTTTVDADGAVTGTTGGYNGAAGGETIAVQLTVDTAPTNQTETTGDSATFTALATADAATSYTTGTPNYGTADNANAGVTYQWYIGDPN